MLVHENVHADLLAAIYRAADLCLVSSLQDGMNLVAKEFVASQVDEHGVLVLSRFTGAAEEIEEAVLINPFNVAGFADGIRTALEMEPGERRRRMRAMRAQLHRSTIFDWLVGILVAVRRSDGWRAWRRPDVERQRPPAAVADVAESARTSRRASQRHGETRTHEALTRRSRRVARRARRDRDSVRASAGPTARVMLDIDGTLAPIAPNPLFARVPTGDPATSSRRSPRGRT